MRNRWTKVALVVALAIALAPRTALAFCGFYVSSADAALYNNATQVVLMRDGTRTVLSMENNYQGPPKDFAMVVPVPVVLQKENVKTLPKGVFAKVNQLAAPRLVEYWERDPCQKEEPPPAPGAAMPLMMRGAVGRGGGGADLGVTIEAKFTVGEYDVLILSAKDSGGLDAWLRREKYAIPAGAEPILRPYVAGQMKFFVAKVNAAKVTFDDRGMATLSPLRFHYDSETFSLPIRLGLVNSSGTQDLVVHVLAKGQRYEVANYPNVTVPTNFDVTDATRDHFGSFYAALLDQTLEKNPKAIVTEYAWSSGTCDPCPTPPLEPSDLATLGADVLPSSSPAPLQGATRLPPGASPRPGRIGGLIFRGNDFVLTRLHARYGKDAVGEDLVFRAAPPIVGGRELVVKDGKLEHTAQQAGTNNFQARYAIRHPWTGPIACTDPVRGRWGGPPANQSTSTRAATDTAFAPRDVKLASFTTASIPDALVLGAAAGANGASSGSSDAIDAGASADASASDAGATPPTQPASRGCAGCSSAPGRGGAPLGIAALLLGLAALRRRRA